MNGVALSRGLLTSCLYRSFSVRMTVAYFRTTEPARFGQRICFITASLFGRNQMYVLILTFVSAVLSHTTTVALSPGQAGRLDACSFHPTSICNTPQQHHRRGGCAQPRGHLAGHRLGHLWVRLCCCKVPTKGGTGSGYCCCMYNLTRIFHTNNSISGRADASTVGRRRHAAAQH